MRAVRDPQPVSGVRFEVLALRLLGAISVAVFTLTILIVGVRLLLLARRTGKPPELWLGLAMSVPVVGNVVVVVGLDAGLPDALGWPIAAVGSLIINLGFAAIGAFNWQVYRPGARWARRLTWAIVVAAVAMPATSLFLPHTAGQSLMYWPEFGLRAGCYLWGAGEAFRYFRVMQRRVRFGLGDPLVANRFLLWGLGCGFGLLMLIGLTVGRVPASGDVRSAIEAAGAAFGLPAAVCIWLAFFGPAWYRRNFEARAQADAQQTGGG
jgi:hypothetical protein